MFGLFFILMSFLVMTLVSQSIEESKGTYNYYLNKNREYALKKIKENYEFYMMVPVQSGANYQIDTTNLKIMPNFKNLSASISEVIPFDYATTYKPDFEDVRLFLNSSSGGTYINQNAIRLMVADASQSDEYFSSAGNWPNASSLDYAQQIEYGRQIIFDSFKLQNATDFLPISSCATPSAWDDRRYAYCEPKDKNAYYFKIESKEYVNKLLYIQKRRLNMTQEKIYRAVQAQATPFWYNLNAPIQVQLLYAISASNVSPTLPLNCSGSYPFVPNLLNNPTVVAELDCSDIIGIYGQPIQYHYFDTKHIALALTLPTYHTAVSTTTQEYNYDIFSDLDTTYIN